MPLKKILQVTPFMIVRFSEDLPAIQQRSLYYLRYARPLSDINQVNSQAIVEALLHPITS